MTFAHVSHNSLLGRTLENKYSTLFLFLHSPASVSGQADTAGSQTGLPPRTQREVLHLNAGWRTPENCVVLEKIRTSPLNGKVPVCQDMKSKRAPLSLNGQKIHLKQKRVKVPGLWQDD